MLLENVAPVLKTIQSMSAQDTQQSCSDQRSSDVSFPVKEPLLIGNEVEVKGEEKAVDDFDALFTGGGSSSSKTEKNNNKVSHTGAAVVVDRAATGEWRWNGSDFVWMAAAVTDAKKEGVDIEKEVTIGGLNRATRRAEMKTAVQPAEDGEDVSLSSLLPKNRLKSATLQSATADRGQLGSDSSAAGHSTPSTVESGDVEIIEEEEEEVREEVNGSDFAPLEWFNRPSTFKTYGYNSSTYGSGKNNVNASSGGKRSKDATTEVEVETVPAVPDVFKSKKRRGAAAVAGSGAAAVGMDGLLSLAETERLFEAIVAGRTAGGHLGTTGSSFTQESFKTASTSSLSEGSSKEKKKIKQSLGSVGDSDW